MTKSESYQNYKKYRASLYASINWQKGHLTKIRNSKILRKDEQILVDQLLDKLTELSSTIKANDIATVAIAVQNKQIQTAME